MRLSARLQTLSLLVVATMILLLRARLGVPWTALAPPAVAVAVIGLVAAWFLARSITAPVRELTVVTRDLAGGDLSSRPALSGVEEVRDLSTAIRRLAEQLGSRREALEAEDALLTALIESLNEGVLAINAGRLVVRINAAGRNVLGVRHPVPFSTDQLPRLRELHHAVQRALAGGATEPTELNFRNRTISVTARPLEGGGAVLALLDLTRMRRLEMVRRDFVANVSHELRTPLTVIAGFAETLTEDDLPADTRKQFAGTIRTHTERMQRIVDDLLDLSRLEAGRWVPDAGPLDLEQIASESVAAAHAGAAAKGLAIDTAIAPDARIVVADRTAMRQVLSNLVENAVRHTSAGCVTIFARREKNGVRVGVRDTGLGIAPEHLPRIFERFYRVESGRARQTGGTGLGLAIVKHLVEAHGGRVDAESELGSGTRISAFFPDKHPDTDTSVLRES